MQRKPWTLNITKSMRTATFTLLGSAVYLWLAASPATAQEPPNPISDAVKVSVNGAEVLSFSITESEEGMPFVITVPGTIIEL